MDTASSSLDAAWWTAGGSAARSGLGSQRGPLRRHPSRRFAGRGAIQAAVVFDGEGRALVADLAGAVQAYAATGSLLWRVQLNGGISAAPAVDVAGFRGFVGTHTGRVQALDTRTGATIWQRELPTASDPRILSDLLYLAPVGLVVLSSWGGRFRALDAASGAARLAWDAGISPASAASADHDGNLYCLRAVAERGTELVQVTLAGVEQVLHGVGEGQRGARRMLTTAAPVVDEVRHRVYAVMNPDRGSVLVAWSVREQKVTWTCPLPNAVQATPTLDGEGRLFLPDLAGVIQRVNPEGRLESAIPLGCEYLLAGGVCDADGRFHVGDPWGRIHTVEAGTRHRVLFEAHRSVQGRPAFGSDGSLYVPCTDHEAYGFVPASQAA